MNDEFEIKEYKVIAPFLGLRAGQFTQFRTNEAGKYIESGCLELVEQTIKIANKLK